MDSFQDRYGEPRVVDSVLGLFHLRACCDGDHGRPWPRTFPLSPDQASSVEKILFNRRLRSDLHYIALEPLTCSFVQTFQRFGFQNRSGIQV